MLRVSLSHTSSSSSTARCGVLGERGDGACDCCCGFGGCVALSFSELPVGASPFLYFVSNALDHSVAHGKRKQAQKVSNLSKESNRTRRTRTYLATFGFGRLRLLCQNSAFFVLASLLEILLFSLRFWYWQRCVPVATLEPSPYSLLCVERAKSVGPLGLCAASFWSEERSCAVIRFVFVLVRLWVCPAKLAEN